MDPRSNNLNFTFINMYELQKNESLDQKNYQKCSYKINSQPNDLKQTTIYF